MPDALTMTRNRDLEGRRWEAWLRRGLLLLVLALVAAGLAGVFGQRPSRASAETAAARLEVFAPTRVRGGLLFQARFRVEARRELRDATLVLDPGWLDGITVNTIEPSPVGEASRDGRLALELGHVPAGERHDLYLDFQVNPTTVGSRSVAVELLDGPARVLSLDRTLTVFP